MNNHILVVVPTRNRPGNAEDTYKSWQDTTEGKSDLLFAVDEDDQLLDEYKRIRDSLGAQLYIGPRKRIGPTLNDIAYNNRLNYDLIGFLGDDHRFRTQGWETMVMDAWGDYDNGCYDIIYGNDLLRGEELPTACFMASWIIDTLGYMVPPTLEHMYLDDAWLRWGKELDSIKYIPEMIIEHMHFTAGKAPNDAMYQSVNNSEQMQRDAKAYEIYLAERFDEDMLHLLGG